MVGLLNFPELVDKCLNNECISVMRSFQGLQSGKLVDLDEVGRGNTLHNAADRNLLQQCLPTIISQYGVSQSTAQWVSTGYQLVAGLMIPLSAWIFHKFNVQHTYFVLAAIFLTGCLLGFFANSFAWLLAGRLVQAIAAGSMIPLIQNVVLILYPEKNRGTVMGMIGLVVAFGPALGPTLGGWIIDNLGLSWAEVCPLTAPLTLQATPSVYRSMLAFCHLR